jgi:hypothetical protein
MSKKKVYLVIFQATINGQLAQTDISTIKDPMNSRQVRRDLEIVARKAFERLAADIGKVFASTDKIKCSDIIAITEDDEQEQAAAAGIPEPGH